MRRMTPRTPGIFCSLGLLFILLLTHPGPIHAQSPAHLDVGRFSSFSAGDSLPVGWQPLTFSRIERHTD